MHINFQVRTVSLKKVMVILQNMLQVASATPTSCCLGMWTAKTMSTGVQPHQMKCFKGLCIPKNALPGLPCLSTASLDHTGSRMQMRGPRQSTPSTIWWGQEVLGCFRSMQRGHTGWAMVPAGRGYSPYVEWLTEESLSQQTDQQKIRCRVGPQFPRFEPPRFLSLGVLERQCLQEQSPDHPRAQESHHSGNLPAKMCQGREQLRKAGASLSWASQRPLGACSVEWPYIFSETQYGLEILCAYHAEAC